MAKISKQYYLQEDVVALAKDLLGKVLVTRIDRKLTAGIITETEAYAGINDKASHAYNGRRTARTETMFAEGGTAYVYLCYGIHHLFNIVSNQKDIPHAVLVRGIKPVKGIEHMLVRRGLEKPKANISAGPGTLSQALGITTGLSGVDLCSSKIWLEDDGIKPAAEKIIIGPRIGIDYAEEDALLPYRFLTSFQ
jgi:DNA-3-methyladenine glycosylase